MSSLAHSLVMRKSSWHSRMYHLWLSLGGKKPEYKENLCRYFWIVVLRGPLRWFFKGRIKRTEPPWLVALTASVLTGIALAFYFWPSVSLKVLMGIGALVVLVLLGIGVSYLYDQDPQRTKAIAKWGTSPIWALPYVIVKLALWIWMFLEKPVKGAAYAFVYGIYWPWLNPLAFTIMGGIAAFGYFDTAGFLKLLEIIGICIGVVIVGASVFIGALKMKEQWRYRNETWLDRLADGVVDTVKLGATYVSTKKRGSWVCPFIEFEKV